MLLLVTSAQATLDPHRTPSLGRLVQPRHYSNLASTLRAGMQWAVDNDCYQGLSVDRYYRMLDKIKAALVAFNGDTLYQEHWEGLPLFVNVPDVVANADATLALWYRWQSGVRRRGLPVGFVAQNGCEHGVMPPWHEFDALFIGGDDQWKLGPEVRSLVAEAKRRGKHVHMGRVNSVRRLRYALAIGCDSVDGTKYCRFRDTYLDKELRVLDYPQLELAAA